LNKKYKLIIHNGTRASEADISFNGLKSSMTTVDFKYLYPGVNIFTLFNEKNKPIAERLYFNFNGLPQASIAKTESRQIKNDSLEIKMSIATVDVKKLQNLSVSVLPSETKSYNHHHNIISAIYLQPNLKSTVEQASYYFIDTDDKKKYELDNLMLTQGWSSYDWTTIFNAPPESVYNFEVGINYIININNSKTKNLMIYPNINTKSELLSLEKNQKSFEKRGFFPLDDEKLRIGEIKSNGELGRSSAVLQFSPSKISSFNTNYKPKSMLRANQYAAIDVNSFKFDNIEALDEVQLYAKKKYTRIEKLQNKNLGQITDFGEYERKYYRTFGQFISSRGFEVDETHSTVDTSLVSSRFRIVVDYVVVNRSGAGEGIRGGAGVIRIYTDPYKKFNYKSKVTFTAYDIPLTYSTPQRFYIPKYSLYDSKFYKEYGVVDWLPNVKIDANGDITFKILNTNTDLKLFIEGLVNNKELISQQIEINN